MTGRRSALVVTLVVAVAAAAFGLRLARSAAPPRPVANHAFPSASDPRAPAVVWAVGDGADGGAAAKTLARRIAAARPDRLLYLGDVYERGSARDFRTNYETVYGELARVTAPTPGNHDWPAHPDGYDPYWSRQTGAPTPPWYAFRIGGWRIISLNSEAPHDAGSAQMRWLQREVRSRSGTCTLAFWHRPLQSAGSHGDQRDVSALWQALRGHASLVLNGHDHDLQRFRRYNGITQLVVGAGGKSRYGLNDDTRLAYGDDRHDGAVRLTLLPGSARIRFISSGGAVLDKSTVSCRRPDLQPAASRGSATAP